jgi:exopolysaccharide production protein ExoQ
MDAGVIHSEYEAVADSRRFPWVVLLFLTMVFFIIGHEPHNALKYHRVGVYQNYLEDENRVVDDATSRIQEGSLKRQLGLLTLGLFGVVVLLRQRWAILRFKGALGWIMVFFIFWTLTSILWADNPYLTFRKLAVFTIFWVAILAFLAMDLSVSQIITFAFLNTLSYLIVGFLLEIILGTFHPLAPGYQFAGTLHPNHQGINCGICLISGIFLLKEAKRARALIFAGIICALLFLVLTKSRTAVGATLGALGVTWIMTSTTSKRVMLVVNVILAAALFLALFGESLLPTLRDAVLLGRDSTNFDSLTGRTPLWSQCLEFAGKHPILGYGYDSFWTPRRVGYFSYTQGWMITEAHSTFLDFLLGVGIPGLIAYVAMMIIGIVKSIRLCRSTLKPHCAFIPAILIFTLIDNLTESALLSPVFFSFLVFFILAYLAIHSQVETTADLKFFD